MEFNRFSSRKASCDSDGEINERSEYVNPFGTSSRRAHPQPASTGASTGAGTLRTRASRIPLSVEEARQLQRRQQPGSSSGSEPAKPVFLSKAQRAQLALEQRQREAAEVRQRRDSEVRAFQRGSPADADATGAGERRGTRAPRRRSRSPEHSAPVGRAATHRAPEHSAPVGRAATHRAPEHSAPVGRAATHRAPEHFALVGRAGTDGSGDRVLTELERQAIRQRYLAGDTTAGRRQHRQQGGRRVVFEWDAAEDTSRDISDLYERRALPPPRTSAGAAGILDDRHWSAKPLGEMRDRDWRIFREDFGISCKGGAVPQPLRSWRESAVPEAILRAIADIGYVEPTPIQRQAIPVGLQRRDLIGLAETGSGKTAAFLVPLLANIVGMPPAAANDGPYALVLAPTRELALQIDAEAHKFARRLGVRSVSIVGGHDIEAQAQQLRRGAELVIATPGRLRDVLERRMLVLGRCGHVVMDEADRMIDMGFEDDVNFILDALPPRSERPRQTTMFSATMPPPVERLARKYLASPATVTIGTAGQAVDSVEQRVEFVAGEDRRKARLLALLAQHAGKAIVFVNQKKSADLLASALQRSRRSVVALHGGKTQEQREHALARLKAGDADVLVATDVAGRGIDVKDVALVVNFDMSKDIEAYTHRVGRTGRAGKRGLAVTFVSAAEDAAVLYDLRRMLVASPLSRCPPELANLEAAQAPPGLMKGAARKMR